MSFVPPYCPRAACPSHQPGRAFLWHRRGYYWRRCDGRRVQRFHCRSCKQSFSSQSFRLDFGLQLPYLHLRLFPLLASKVTMRQAAKICGVSRHTVSRRLLLLGNHCREAQRTRLMRAREKGAFGTTFQLDELETFEGDRRLCPITMPVLIDKHSYFVVHVECGTLPARGGLRPHDRKRRQEREKKYGKRRSQSREVVERSLRTLAAILPGDRAVEIQTDQKKTYVRLVRNAFPQRLVAHVRESSKKARNYTNVLFPINHTLAMMRDGVSRLVRRSWGASKRMSRLELHVWLWMAYRNYVRGVTSDESEETSAMSAGVVERRLGVAELLRWRGVFLVSDLQSLRPDSGRIRLLWNRRPAFAQPLCSPVS